MSKIIDISVYTDDLIQDKGIYFAKHTSEISYPESGNDDCFQLEDSSFWFDHRNKCITDVVVKYSSNKVFFDIGGGNGYVTKGLQEKGVEVVLVEPGVQGCFNAKKRGVNNIVCSTLENANFHKESIDSIGVFDVVEHIKNDDEFLRSMYSYLKEGGYLFLTVPTFNFLWSKDDEYAGHFRRYKISQMNKKLKDLGFTVEYSSYFFSILIVPIFIFRTIPSLFKKKNTEKSVDEYKKEHNSKKGFIEKVVQFFLKKELEKIKRGKKNRFGSSCLIVAKK